MKIDRHCNHSESLYVCVMLYVLSKCLVGRICLATEQYKV